MQAWFVSDIHIKDINQRSSIILLRFLHSIIEKKRPATHLVLLGDIFDLWISDAPVFIRKFQAIVDAITEIKRQGVEVIYFEGNHDVHVKHFWQNQLNIPTYVDFQVMDFGPYKIRLEHGDLINPDDLNYLKYRSFIRKPYMEAIAPYVAGRLLDEIGNFASRMSRKKSSVRRTVDQELYRTMIHTYAKKAFEETPFDVLITGHMHVQDDYKFEMNSKKARSINLGSWFEGPKALSINESKIEFVDLE